MSDAEDLESILRGVSGLQASGAFWTSPAHHSQMTPASKVLYLNSGCHRISDCDFVAFWISAGRPTPLLRFASHCFRVPRTRIWQTKGY